MRKEPLSQSYSKNVKEGIKKLKNWMISKNIKSFLMNRKSDIAMTSGISLIIGAGAVAALTIGGSELALPIASWGGAGVASRVIFYDIWNNAKQHILKKRGQKKLSDKEAAKYIMNIEPSQLNELAVALYNNFKDDSEIKLFLSYIVKDAIESDEFKQILGQVLADTIKSDMETQLRAILEEVKKCGIRNFYEILLDSQKIDFKSVFEKFRRTIRISPEELVCVITNKSTIERTLEKDVIKNIDSGKNVLILGISGSGKTVFLMKVCYRLHLEGWKVFFTNEGIDSQKSRELFARTEGKKIIVIDNGAKYDEYFDLIENLRSDVMVVMAEQDIIWKNKNRSVKGYNFNELKLEFSEEEGVDYINKFGGNIKLLKVSKNVFPILTFLITGGEESLEKLIDVFWNNLSVDEKRVIYPILVLSSIDIDYPFKLFNEIYNSPDIIEMLQSKNIVDIKKSTYSTIHSLLSQIIVSKSIRDRFEVLGVLFNKINEKKTNEKTEYLKFLSFLSYGLSHFGEMTRIKKYFLYANKFYDMWIKINPKDFNAFFGKAQNLRYMHKYTEALNYYDKASHMESKWVFAALVNKGSIFKLMGKHSEELKCYEKALEINPQDSTALSNKAKILIDEGKNVESLELLNKALEIDPKYDIAWANKAAALMHIGKYVEGLECCNKALEINPQASAALNNKGAALIHMEKYDEALKYLNKATEIDPNDSVAWLNKSNIYSKKKDKKNTLICLSKAIKIDKNIKEKIKKDVDFKWLWYFRDFKKLVS